MTAPTSEPKTKDGPSPAPAPTSTTPMGAAASEAPAGVKTDKPAEKAVGGKPPSAAQDPLLPGEKPRPLREGAWKGLVSLGIIGLVACLVLVGVAVFQRELGPVQAAIGTVGVTSLLMVLFLLATSGRILIEELLVALRVDGPPRFERHWGGLGGNVGGWTISRSFVFLIGFAAVLAALVAVLGEARSLSAYLLEKQSAAATATEEIKSTLQESRAAAASSLPQNTTNEEPVTDVNVKEPELP